MAIAVKSQLWRDPFTLFFEIDSASLNDLARVLDKVSDALGPAATAITEQSMARAVERLRANIAARAPVGATGELRRRVESEVRVPSSGKAVDVTGSVFINELAYAVPVNEGSRPHWAPLAPLEYWVERKLKLQGEEAKRVARLIQYKIHAHGAKAQPFFDEGIEDSLNYIESTFEDAADTILRMIMEGA